MSITPTTVVIIMTATTIIMKIMIMIMTIRIIIIHLYVIQIGLSETWNINIPRWVQAILLQATAELTGIISLSGNQKYIQ